VKPGLRPGLRPPESHQPFTKSTPTPERRQHTVCGMRIGIVSQHASPTNIGLAAAAPDGVDAFVVAPADALRKLRPGDAALGRLDVLPTVDGIEEGLWCLERLELGSVFVLNRALTLRLAHDKLATAEALAAAALPHPRTRLVAAGDSPPLPFPLVLKPRFGSWGRDVVRCEHPADYEAALTEYSERRWFQTAGAVAQALVPPLGHDLRLVVAGGEVIGSVRRVAPPGEWRTNIALGARREPIDANPAACELAVAAAQAIGADLVGVDLLPLGPGRYVVLELNGAVDFSRENSPRENVFGAAMHALIRGRLPLPVLPELAEAGAW
jgi:RimK family alpha-L-glutamate ligase